MQNNSIILYPRSKEEQHLHKDKKEEEKNI